MIFDVDGLRMLIEDTMRRVLREESATAGANDEYLGTKQAAKLASVSTKTLRTWIHEGRLNRYTAGEHLRIKRSELEALLAAPSEESPEVTADRILNGGRKKRTTR